MMKKALIAIFVPVAILSVAGYFAFLSYVTIRPPKVKENGFFEIPVTAKGQNTFTCGKSWMRKNVDGLYDVYAVSYTHLTLPTKRIV